MRRTAFRQFGVAVMAVASIVATGGPGGRRPPPLPEGPAGPPARLPDGSIARPPPVRSPVVSAGCPVPPYGPTFYAPGSGKTVALTFDDGPGASTSAILGILRSSKVAATFFNLGQNMAARPALIRREANDGFALGNHTWDHPDLRRLSLSGQASELDRASAEQRRLTSSAPCAFRPPYGAYNASTLRLSRLRRMRVWLWSVDPEDWKAGRSRSSYWVNRIVSLAESQGGGQQHPVVILHNQPPGNPATVLALPRIIRFFRLRHYRFVALTPGG